MAKVARGRVFAFLSYLDRDTVKEALTDAHVPYYFIEHDDNDIRHTHIVVLFSSLKSCTQVASLYSSICANEHVEIVNSTGAYLRYLCHLDNPEKQKYDPNVVVSGCGAVQYSQFIASLDSERDSLAIVLSFIAENGFISFSDLCLYAIRNDATLWQDIKACPTNFLVSFIKSFAWTKGD